MGDIDFGSSSSSENLTEIVPSEPVVHQIKFRVPSTPALDKENICQILGPYEYFVQQLQGILFFHRPIHFTVLAASTNLLMVLIYKTKIGFFSTTVLIFSLYILSCIIWQRHKEFFVTYVFTQLPEIKSDLPNRIYSLEDISFTLSIVLSRIHCFILGCRVKALDPSIISKLLWISFLVPFFFVFRIARTFYIMCFSINCALFLPGILLHPKVFVYSSTYLQQIMMTLAPKIKDE